MADEIVAYMGWGISAQEQIDGLRREVRELKAENAKLLAARDTWAENDARLRELVRDMMRFFEDGDWCTTCEQVRKCDAQEQYEEDCLMRGVFHDRMRELGMEVDADA